MKSAHDNQGETDWPTVATNYVAPSLLLCASQTRHERLQENALTSDQRLKPTANDWWLTTGSQHLSQGLDLWLLSQGEHLEVFEPTELREQIITR
ncbi:WYL domain-containing protein [Pseudomonas aeruginosa]